MSNDAPKPLIEHIIELRGVLLSCFAYITVGMVVSMLFSEDIFHFLLTPMSQCFKESKVIYTSISEPVVTELRISFYSSILLSFPFILAKIWGFVKVGLNKNEILFVRKYGIVSFLLFIVGIVFAYYIAIPTIIEGLQTWSFSKNAVFLPKMSENISFVLVLMVSFGVSFQIPIVMFLLDKIGVVPLLKQKRYWREYIVVVTIASAIITPPDALSMLFMACPLVALYVITILFWRLRKCEQ